MRREKAAARAAAIPDSALVASGRASPSLARQTLKVALAEFAVFAGTALVASIVYHRTVYGAAPSLAQYASASLLLGGFYSLICLLDDQYDLLGEKWTRSGLARAAGAAALAFTFFLAVSFLFKIADDYSRGTFLAQIAIVFPALIATRASLGYGIAAAKAAGKIAGHRIVVVVLGEKGRAVRLERPTFDKPDKVLAWHEPDTSGPEADVARVLGAIRDECRKARADVVVLAFEANQTAALAKAFDVFSELPVRIQLIPVDMLAVLQASKVHFRGPLRVLEIAPRPSTFVDRLLKRAFDIVVALAALVVFSPLMLFAALAIKLDSPGPVLFRQWRRGFNNEPIEVLKFRTMAHGSEARGFRQATRNDSRVTRIGWYLRRSNIDELPQLFNVLRGDMSIVGPRPHAIEHNDMYLDSIRLLSRRHNVKPGITGWAQIHGLRGETDTHEKMLKRVEADLYYVDNWSFFLDVKILLLTVFSRKVYRNAY
jgi:Undecaprenyl-phosphate glucose phosphotransferase